MEFGLWWTVPVPVALVGDRVLPPGARYLYMVLMHRRVRGTWTCRIAGRELLAYPGLRSAHGLRAHVGRLVDSGWLRIERARGRQPGAYHLRTPDGPVSASRTVAVPASLITLPDVPPSAKCLYAALLAHCDRQKQTCSARQEEVLRWAGLGSQHTLQAQCRRLQEAGWLRIGRASGPHCTTYEVLDPHRAAREAERERVRMRLEREAYKGEGVMKELANVQVASDRFQDNARPGFLVNPLTGERLEFDRWYTEGVALEFNGRQHYRPTDAFPDPEQQRQQRTRDLVKLALAREHGVKVVVLHPEDLTFEGLRAKLEGLLPLRELHEEDPVVQYLTGVSRRYVRKASRSLPPGAVTGTGAIPLQSRTTAARR